MSQNESDDPVYRNRFGMFVQYFKVWFSLVTGFGVYLWYVQDIPMVRTPMVRTPMVHTPMVCTPMVCTPMTSM